MQVVYNNLNPTWRPFRVSLRSLCGGDVEKPIKVKVFFHHDLFPETGSASVGLIDHTTNILIIHLLTAFSFHPKTKEYFFDAAG